MAISHNSETLHSLLDYSDIRPSLYITDYNGCTFITIFLFMAMKYFTCKPKT